MKVFTFFMVFFLFFSQNLYADEEKPDTENKKEKIKGTDAVDLDDEEDSSKADERKKEREKEKKKEKRDKKKKGKKGKCKV